MAMNKRTCPCWCHQDPQPDYNSYRDYFESHTSSKEDPCDDCNAESVLKAQDTLITQLKRQLAAERQRADNWMHEYEKEHQYFIACSNEYENERQLSGRIKQERDGALGCAKEAEKSRQYILTELLVRIAGAKYPTPEEGYLKAGLHWLFRDIEQVIRDKEEAERKVEELREAWLKQLAFARDKLQYQPGGVGGAALRSMERFAEEALAAAPDESEPCFCATELDCAPCIDRGYHGADKCDLCQPHVLRDESEVTPQ